MFVHAMDKSSILEITVCPKSSRNEIYLHEDGSVRVYLNAPPVDNRANIECVKLFSKTLKLPKTRITIMKGEKSRKKSLLVVGMDHVEVWDKLRENSKKT
jgi:uncharacterized protein (TIGR00251 family)